MPILCVSCGDEPAEPVALVDYETEEGPYCVGCALESLADAHAATTDGGALRVFRHLDEERAWIWRGASTITRRDNPPSWVEDEDTWIRAKAAVAPRWEDYREPWAVVVDVYRAMGGRTA